MTPTRLEAPELCHTLDLVRDDWRGAVAVVLVPAGRYAALEAGRASFLGPRETAVLDGLMHERRRASYLLGRFAAKTALARIAAIADPRAVDIVPGCFQQPVVMAPGHHGLAVSISHSGEWGCAIAYPESHPMGVDVEEVNEARAEVMQTQFTRRELDLARAAGAERPLVSAVLWTAKESLSKVLRCGMTVPFPLLDTDAVEAVNGGYRGAFTHFSQYAFRSRLHRGAVVTLTLPRRTTLGGAAGLEW